MSGRIWLSCLGKNRNYLKELKSQVASYSSRKTDRVQLAYTIFDPGTPSYDVTCPLLILPGIYCSRHDWTTIAHDLSIDINQRVITIDPRNHGDSQHSPEHSHVHMANDICHFMEHLKINKCMLMGHSMGGVTAMVFGLTYQKLVEKLVLLDVSPFRAGRSYPKLKVYFPVMHEIQIKYEGSGKSYWEVRQEVEDALIPLAKPWERGVLLNQLDSHPQTGEAFWKINLPVLCETFDRQDKVPEELWSKTYDGPTLILRSGHSTYVPLSDGPGIQKIFTKAQIRTVDNAGHSVQRDNLEHCRQLWLPFLKGNSG